MSSISINLNLTQLKHAVITSKKGAKCIVIPIVENQLIEGEKGIYLSATGFEIKNKVSESKDTHLVKQTFKKEVYEAMTEEQKRAMPVLGNLIVWAGHQEPEPVKSDVESGDIQGDGLTF